MDYKTYEPGTDLNPFVKCYWTLESPREVIPEKQTIVPDGCLEMIFHYGDLYKQYIENQETIVQPRCFVIGQLTRPLEIESTGETGIFSVRFHPNGFLPFSVIPIKEMENKAIPLEKIFGKEVLETEQNVLQSNSALERIKHIEAFLLHQLTDAKTIDRIVKSAIESIFMANGTLSINELSKQKNINRKQLERKFSAAIGLSPKQLSKTIRLQNTLKMMLNNSFTSFTELAYENEYYDQAHFIKDFKEFTGFTPKEFYGDNLKLSSLFYGSE
ncbi:helix-turn-helix transcriptional regulator [Flavobacterium amniphilum]|uniref:helix-turn-helix transcriptional regulator n=1 Tax=Flavobacterium amniphilum TaxID=1834035 RepID=UPI002029B890|nr:helix-turn-helix transcriptional regulator [Flavobacterium amniphilum]MCL9807688.1 helix-turn-helix transcriptional regulator [Flavobacterium amniphilum]